MNTERRTRIVGTIGPASRDPETLTRLLEVGLDVCRINCSHGTAESIRADFARIRRIATTLSRSVAILLDLQGPKIRVGTIEPPLPLKNGDILTVVMDNQMVSDGFRVGTTWPSMANDVEVGEAVLFADGTLSGRVHAVRRDITPAEVDILMEVGGELKSRKGINLPETTIKAPAMTEKDKADLAVGVAAGADYVALSFVRHADDIAVLKAELEKHGKPDLPIIAKIEKPQGVANIDEILAVVDGIMVARGDLGVEIPLQQVPVVQKELITRSNRQGKLVITATQMLDSMERNPRPTRAEAADVANAIVDGTDAVMLSGETAAGNWPVRSVEVMDAIAREVEQSDYFRRPNLDSLPALNNSERTVAWAACYAVREIPRPLVVFTWSGHAAILASKTRPKMGIYALTPHSTVCDQLRLAWGVTALQVPFIDSTDDLIAKGEQILIESGLLERGIEIVVMAGNTPLRGATNILKIEKLDGVSS
ncbi:MAG: pyruvate kinase [Myxococcota bacterium]